MRPKTIKALAQWLKRLTQKQIGYSARLLACVSLAECDLLIAAYQA